MEIKYIYEKRLPIKESFLVYIQNELSPNTQDVEIRKEQNQDIHIFKIKDKIVDGERLINLLFKIENNDLLNIEICSEDDGIITEYDLRDYLVSFLHKVYETQYIGEVKKYTIRNYYRYYNSSSMKIDMVLNLKYRTRLKSFYSEYNQEPLNENILLVDVEIQAVNLRHAMSIAYNYTKDLVAYLSVLLDVGFETIISERRWFAYKDERKISLKRFRTSFIDSELDLLIKDNLNGIKSKSDPDYDKFWTGILSYSFISDFDKVKDASMFVLNVADNKYVNETFLNHSIKNNKDTSYGDSIAIEPHFPNMQIKIPKQIKNYFRNIEKLEPKTQKYFLAAARMYNLSLTALKYEPTASVSYKVSCIDTLEKNENETSFSNFIQKYYDKEIDKKLLDYYYGSIRSGHFHSGVFSFNEYETSLLTEFDTLLKEKRDQMLRFNYIIRHVLVSWIEMNILS